MFEISVTVAPVELPCPGVSAGFVDCANSDGMRNPKWRRRFEWSKQLDSLNRQFFGNHSYRYGCREASYCVGFD